MVVLSTIILLAIIIDLVGGSLLAFVTLMM